MEYQTIKSYSNSPSTTASLLFIIILVISVVAAFDSTNSVSSSQTQQFDKRQPIPMPRIGRSSSYYPVKRQMLIPAPRIGRRDANTQNSHKITRSIDCSNNPDLCENFETAGTMGGTNEDLIEPLDIQLRAAFIPRLGKRSSHSKSSSPTSTISTDEDLIDIYRPSTIGGRIFGFIPRNQQSLSSTLNLIDSIDNGEDDPIDESNLQRLMILRDLLAQNGGSWFGNKRAMLAASPYTPRIGRAVFAPRIGKKAAFVPRIG